MVSASFSWLRPVRSRSWRQRLPKDFLRRVSSMNTDSPLVVFEPTDYIQQIADRYISPQNTVHERRRIDVFCELVRERISFLALPEEE